MYKWRMDVTLLIHEEREAVPKRINLSLEKEMPIQPHKEYLMNHGEEDEIIFYIDYIVYDMFDDEFYVRFKGHEVHAEIIDWTLRELKKLGWE